MSQDITAAFLRADTVGRQRLASNSANADVLTTLLGAQALRELRELDVPVDSAHLAFDGPPNLVFAPGIMGSLLESRSLGGVWWIDVRSRGHLNDLRLAPDGLLDADPSNDVAPFNIDLTYEPFLRAALRSDDFTHRSFAYDWRKSLMASSERLRCLIVAMHNEGGEPVHLIGHSMGGLILRVALRLYDELWDRVGRIVFIGTPHYGSPSIAGYLKGHFRGFSLMALLGLYLDRATFRSLWGALSLLPAPVGVYPGTRPGETGPGGDGDYPHPTSNFDLYDAGAWNLDLADEEHRQLQNVLDSVATVHRELADWHHSLDQGRRDRMAVIAGVGFKTLFRLARRGGALATFSEMDKIVHRIEGDAHREGDGRVPLASAQLEHVGETRFVRGVHGQLVNMPAVYADAFRFLRGEAMQLTTSAAAALHPHLGDEPASVDSPSLTSVALPTVEYDDPGYLDYEQPDDEELAELDVEVDAGRVPDFRRVRLL